MSAISELPIASQLWLNTLAWCPNPAQQQKFEQFYWAMLAANLQVNLTRITDANDFWEKHLWDALSGIQPWLGDCTIVPNLRVVDIGSGAGVPGVPVAVARPDWQVTLLEARRKKVNFLDSLPGLLELDNLIPVWGRAEDYHSKASFDLALVRAVGNVAQCLDYALPLVKPGGLVVLYRGQFQPQEAQALAQELPKTGAKLARLLTLSTPLTASQRHCLYIRRPGPDHTPLPD